MRNNLVGFSEETLQKYNLIRTQPVWFNEGEEVLPGICIWQTFTSRITKLLSCSHEVGAKTLFFFYKLMNCNFLSYWHRWRESAPWGYFCFWFHWCILLCYFYHSIMCCLPFLSSLLDWRAGKEKESFTVVCKRMSDLIWRWFRLCAWSGGLWYHYRTSFSHCQLFIIIIVIIIGVLLLCL